MWFPPFLREATGFPPLSRENGVIFDDNELTSSSRGCSHLRKKLDEGGMFLFRTAGIFRCSVLM